MTGPRRHGHGIIGMQKVFGDFERQKNIKFLLPYYDTSGTLPFDLCFCKQAASKCTFICGRCSSAVCLSSVVDG